MIQNIYRIYWPTQTHQIVREYRKNHVSVFFIPLIMLYVWVFFAYHHHRHHHCQLFMQRWWWSLTKFLQILIFDLSSHQFSIIHFIQNAYVCIGLCMCITRNFWITWQWNFIIGHDGERLKISIHETWILFILKRSVCVCTISYVRGSIWSEKKTWEII